MYENEVTDEVLDENSIPVYKCKKLELSADKVFWWILIIAACFYYGFAEPYLRGLGDTSFQTMAIRIAAILLVIYAVIYVIRYLLVRKFGSEVIAKVCAYGKWEIMLTGGETLCMKLLVKRPDGPTYVTYPVKNHEQLFSVNSYIRLKTFKYDCTLVKMPEQYAMNYCGNADDLTQLNIMADLEHSPEALLKNLDMASENLGVAFHLAVPTCALSIIMFILIVMDKLADAASFMLFFAPVGTAAWCFLIRGLLPVFRHLWLKRKGENVPARVWEYLPLNMVYGKSPLWRLKVLTYTEDGYRFLTFSTMSQEQPFEKDAIIELRIYKDNVIQERE